MSHSQTATVNVNQPGSLDPTTQIAVVTAAPTSTTNMTGLRTIKRGSSLRKAWRITARPSASLSLTTFTDFGPPRPSNGRLVASSTSPITRDSGRLRFFATRLAWIRAFAYEICGSTPEAEVVTASGGTCAAVSPGVNGRSRLR